MQRRNLWTLIIVYLLPVIPMMIVYRIIEQSIPAEAKGNLYGISFQLGGPAATYLIFVLLCLHVWKTIQETTITDVFPSAKPSADIKVEEVHDQKIKRILQEGKKYYLQGNQPLAIKKFKEALELATEKDKELGKAESLRWLGISNSLLGMNDMAKSYYEQSLALFKSMEVKLGEANVLVGLGDLQSNLDENDPARESYRQARVFYQQVGDRLGEANVLRGLGDLQSTLGENDPARESYRQARVLFQQVGNRLDRKSVV